MSSCLYLGSNMCSGKSSFGSNTSGSGNNGKCLISPNFSKFSITGNYMSLLKKRDQTFSLLSANLRAIKSAIFSGDSSLNAIRFAPTTASAISSTRVLYRLSRIIKSSTTRRSSFSREMSSVYFGGNGIFYRRGVIFYPNMRAFE